MSRIRVALVGAGAIAASAHLPAITRLADDLELLAVVDIDLLRAQALARDWSVAAAYDDLDTMLRETGPELVLICTPPGEHRAAAITCLDAGAWVWCEKPPALSLADYDEIAAHEREGGPFASYVFQHRFSTGARHLRELVAADALGPLLVGVCHTLWYRDAAYFALPWRGRFETEGGGPTMGHGIHQMDLLLSLLGDWTSVSATTATLARDVETEDVSMAVLRLASGGLVSIVNSVLSPRQTSYLRFDFADGTVELAHLYGYAADDWRWTPAPHLDPAAPSPWNPPADDATSSHAAQLATVAACLRAGIRPPASGRDGRRSLELITGIYAAAASGREVHRSELTPHHDFYDSLGGIRRERTSHA
ncbi:MAG: oxidoreductase [Marmoricola sp.]|nr:oxidoreductase [Marmoricola sp.]